MDNRAAKLALARKKLRDHQEKKTVHKEDNILKPDLSLSTDNSIISVQESNRHDLEEFIIPAKGKEIAEVSYSETQTPDPISTGQHVTTASPNLNPIPLGQNNQTPVTDINVTEILISNKRNLELQVHDLQTKLSQLEYEHESVINDFKICNQKVNDLGNELKNINEKYLHATREALIKNTTINELNSTKTLLSEENSNLLEQLEFTKTVLNAKEAESSSLHSQLYALQNQYDVIYVQLQQLTNGLPACPPNSTAIDNEKTEALLHKIASLEQQVNLLQKERDQMNIHYEHYVAELNEQLKLVNKRNDDLSREVQNLSNRENSLIEQISGMEIRIQNYNINKKEFEMDQETCNIKVLQDDLKKAQDDLNELNIKYNQLISQYAVSEAKVKELSESKDAECNKEKISMTKLSADITSDKVAAQRAAEQNKKLKQNVQGLEEAYVKMSKDKLELTEKLTLEKYLNRELTIKLAEVEEEAKNMQIKLKAKDEEMIRLQSNFRKIEKQCEHLKDQEQNICITNPDEIAKEVKETILENNNLILESDSGCKHNRVTEEVDSLSSQGLQKEDAMSKLQKRFLKIMEEVADLSDEKHRLEHIILQLQNETDTICEYVALYQQQRSLLKRRDEERTAQLKVFQQECGKLKNELEELSGILTRFAEDKELLSYFKVEVKRIDMEKVMTLLSSLKNNSLIDPKKINTEFKNFYPCSCCSGKLIDV